MVVDSRSRCSLRALPPPQIALYIWDEGRGPELQDVPEFCSGPGAHCATAITFPLPDCVGPHVNTAVT